MNAHADGVGFLLVYDCKGVWRYLEKRRRSNQSTFSFSVFFPRALRTEKVSIFQKHYYYEKTIFPFIRAVCFDSPPNPNAGAA
jgi:hypothetical protein